MVLLLLLPSHSDAKTLPSDIIFFDIRNLPLADSLSEFQQQSGIEIIFLNRTVAENTGSAIKGRYSINEALQILLKGTDFYFKFDQNGVFLLHKIPNEIKEVQSDIRVMPTEIEETGIEEIVIRGLRESYRNSIAVKRNASSTVEVLSIIDVGKLPDISIADNIARLPGIAANRTRGNATSEISIRGLGPNVGSTLLNGREIATGNTDRSVNFEQYPAELLSGAHVYKTPVASQIEGGLSGQIDLKTIRPLAFSEERKIVSIRGTTTPIGSDIADASAYGVRGNAAYINQFFNDTLGISVGYSGRARPIATQRTVVFPYTDIFADLNGDGDNESAQIPFGYEFLSRGGKFGSDRRNSAMMTLQWRPSSDLMVDYDLFHSSLSFSENQRGFRLTGLESSDNLLENAEILNGGITGITATGFNGAGVRLNAVNETFHQSDDLFASGLTLNWYVSASSNLLMDLSYSRAGRDQRFITVSTERNSSAEPLVAEFAATPLQPTSFRFNTSLTDPETNRVASLGILGDRIISDDLLAANILWSFTPNDNMEFNSGFRISNRTKSQNDRSFRANIPEAERHPVPDALLLPPLAPANGLFSNIPPVIAFDVAGVVAELFPAAALENNPANTYQIQEDTYSAFATAKLQTHFWGRPAWVYGGLRLMYTDTKSSGAQLIRADGNLREQAVSIGNRFTDVLPNLGIKMELSEKQIVRLSIAKSIARPPTDDMRANMDITTGDNLFAVGGNPKLEPYRATQVDISYEYYPTPNTILSIGPFYKSLSNFIITRDVPFIFGSDQGVLSQPINETGGNLWGVDAFFQQALTFLPSPFDGLGVYATYSYNESDIEVTQSFNVGRFDVPGLSRNVANLQIWYEKSGFEARIAYRYRDDFPTELGDSDQITVNESEGIVDLQLSYHIQHSNSSRGTSLFFQASNLTRTPFVTYHSTLERSARYEDLGRQFFFGVTHSF